MRTNRRAAQRQLEDGPLGRLAMEGTFKEPSGYLSRSAPPTDDEVNKTWGPDIPGCLRAAPGRGREGLGTGPGAPGAGGCSPHPSTAVSGTQERK